MISLCYVTYNRFEGLTDILLDSVVNNCSVINEVIVAKNDAPCSYYEERVIKGNNGRDIIIKTYGHPIYEIYSDMAKIGVDPKNHGHALGMHHALDRATQEYVMFADPDIFFASDTDEFYLDCMEKYDLNIIGVSHHWAHALAGTYFPYVINCMVKRNTLPGPGWHASLLRAKKNSIHLPMSENEHLTDPGYPVPGKWLVGSPLIEFQHLYPRSERFPIFDIGCNLWLWNEERKGKWLSFQTMDVNNYYTSVYRTNFKLRDKFPKRRLIYHLTTGFHAVNKPEIMKAYTEEYDKTKGVYAT